MKPDCVDSAGVRRAPAARTLAWWQTAVRLAAASALVAFAACGPRPEQNTASEPAAPTAEVAPDALREIARRAIVRKTGARGLRSIMEKILLDTMFELPTLEGVREVVISDEVVKGAARPLYIYSERSDEKTNVSA